MNFVLVQFLFVFSPNSYHVCMMLLQHVMVSELFDTRVNFILFSSLVINLMFRTQSVLYHHR